MSLTPECKKVLDDVLYCLDGAIAEFNDRNLGDYDKWMTKVRQHWDLFTETHPEDKSPYEYIRDLSLIRLK